jgi:hypothetical protein
MKIAIFGVFELSKTNPKCQKKSLKNNNLHHLKLFCLQYHPGAKGDPAYTI